MVLTTNKTFWCANGKNCDYHSKQPIENSVAELNGYHLCKNCFGKGYRLRLDVVVYPDRSKR